MTLDHGCPAPLAQALLAALVALADRDPVKVKSTSRASSFQQRMHHRFCRPSTTCERLMTPNSRLFFFYLDSRACLSTSPLMMLRTESSREKEVYMQNRAGRSYH